MPDHGLDFAERMRERRDSPDPYNNDDKEIFINETL
nr:MAG TPA: hypothetical protein [Caudoviricetes sp.]